ncbi:MAG: hypothetical protein ACYC2Y_05720 [Armatimonadota bacterium]
MSFVTRAKISVSFLLGLSAVPACACPSGLAVIPTAEVVDIGSYSLESQFDGTFARGNEETRILNTEFGLSARFEAGVDYDLSEGAETRTLLNAKYILLNKEKSALAVGVCGIGEGVKCATYAVATQDFGGVRGHLGAIRIEGENRWFAGADKVVSERLTLMADYTDGDENASSVGFNYQISESRSIALGAIFPNEGGDAEFTAHFVLGGSYRR